MASSCPNAVNIPQVRAEDMEVLGPYLPLARQLGGWRSGCAAAARAHRRHLRRALAEHDTRLLTTAVLMGAFASRSDEPVNLVNARAVAESRGIVVGEEHARSPATTRT